VSIHIILRILYGIGGMIWSLLTIRRVILGGEDRFYPPCCFVATLNTIELATIFASSPVRHVFSINNSMWSLLPCNIQALHTPDLHTKPKQEGATSNPKISNARVTLLPR